MHIHDFNTYGLKKNQKNPRVSIRTRQYGQPKHVTQLEINISDIVYLLPHAWLDTPGSLYSQTLCCGDCGGSGRIRISHDPDEYDSFTWTGI